MNKTMRRMVAKIDALTARVKVLENGATMRAAYERAEFRAKHSVKDLADLAGFAKENIPDRARTLEMGRLAAPMLELVPAATRAEVVATSTPADMIDALRAEALKMEPELAPFFDATAVALRHHGLTWADLGVGADGAV